uniref:Uncharacterized protein n=1 Tax=Anguilla anguilla TaxID=7936 RepID=A0A0E9QEW4_ANGAN
MHSTEWQLSARFIIVYWSFVLYCQMLA